MPCRLLAYSLRSFGSNSITEIRRRDDGDGSKRWKNAPDAALIKFNSEKLPLSISRRMIVVIKKPEMTKNTSTPPKPPVTPKPPTWYSKTARTAIALSPSMAGR